MYNICDYCINRNSCDTYKNICDKNIIYLYGEYPDFNVIVPMTEYNVCSIDLTCKFTYPIFGTTNKYFLN